MNYQTLMGSSVSYLAEKLISSGGVMNEGEIESFLNQHARQAFPGMGELVDLGLLADAIEKINSQVISWGSKNKDDLEGRVSGLVHAALKDLPIEVQDDPAFWQYLSVKYFLPYVLWRESGSIESRTLATYLNASRNSEQIPLRLFLRGSIAGPDDGYKLAFASQRATDFWRSHLVRVTVGSFENLARRIIREQADSAMSTSILRVFAKIINRQGSNTELYVLETAETDEVVGASRALATEIVEGSKVP